jgi:hypothetical protein
MKLNIMAAWLQVYLNDDFQGGSTTFFTAGEQMQHTWICKHINLLAILQPADRRECC